MFLVVTILERLSPIANNLSLIHESFPTRASRQMESYDDVQRKEDQKVIDVVHRVYGADIKSPYIWLAVVVEMCQYLNQEYGSPGNCIPLLDDDKELLKLVKECIESKRFQKIRDYGEVMVNSGRHLLTFLVHHSRCTESLQEEE